VQLRVSGGVAYRWNPDASLSCTDCSDPVAVPDSTTTYRVLTTGANGCTRLDSITVTVIAAPLLVIAEIERDYRVQPGKTITIPVLLRDSIDAFSLDELQFALEFNPGILRLAFDIAQPESLLVGTLLDGWAIDIDQQIPGHFSARLQAPPGIVLRDTGVLLNLPMQSYIGSVTSTELTFSLEPSDLGCTTLQTLAGRVQLDSLCGLNFRLIEATASKYSLEQNSPNPFSDRSRLGFSIGLDGYTRLVLYNSSGQQVGRLVDGFLEAGSYEVEIDGRALSSGVYVCRLEQGGVVREIQIIRAR
jgi:hypothetical protein